MNRKQRQERPWTTLSAIHELRKLTAQIVMLFWRIKLICLSSVAQQ